MAGTWRKSPPELVAAFEAEIARHPDVAVRPMFGFPCGFVGGNMTTGLFEDRWFVRLPDDERTALLLEPGAALFEPMPGRPMREYAVLPPAFLGDPVAVEAWVRRAIAFARTLPPKP